MHALAEYVLRGRREAILMALLFTFIPLLGWMGVIIMALITLRKGAYEGFIVYAWIVLPILVLSIVFSDVRIFLYDAVCGSLVVYLSAIILRRTESWLLVIQASVLFAAIVIIILHIFNPHIDQMWITRLTKIIQQINANSDTPLTTQDSISTVKWLADYATGIQAAILLLANLFNLAIARWMQAMMFHPGGLKEELYNIRIDNATILTGVLVVVLAFLGIATFKDLSPVILVPFLLSGFSLIHYFANNFRWNWFWLSCFYISVMIFPYILGGLIGVSIGDVWVNFRERFGTKVK